MSKATVIININNKVIVRDDNDAFIWGQVQDIATDSLLIDFDTPQQSPHWIPFNRIFRPPTEVATDRSLPGRAHPYEPNPKKYLFTAMRTDATGPFIWKRSSINDPQSLWGKQNSDFIYLEEMRVNKPSREVVPHIRFFQCLFASGLSDKQILTSNPVSAATFCKVSHTADGFGLKWLKMASNPQYIDLDRDGTRAVCLRIEKDTVTVIARDHPNVTPYEYGIPHQQDCRRFWDILCDVAYWDCRSQEEWEKIQTREKEQLRQIADHVMGNTDLPTIRHLHKNVLIDMFCYLDTLHQMLLKRVCARWYSILTLEAVTNYIHIFGNEDSSSSWRNCSFIPLLTGNGWWHAGRKSSEYRTAKIINIISSNVKTLQIAGVSKEDYSKLHRVFLGLKSDGIKLRTLILERCPVEMGDFESQTEKVTPHILPAVQCTPTSHQILFNIAKHVILADCTIQITGLPYPTCDSRGRDPLDARMDLYCDLVLKVDCFLVHSVEVLVGKRERSDDDLPARKKRDVQQWIGVSQKVSKGSNALDIMQRVQTLENTLRITRKKIRTGLEGLEGPEMDALRKRWEQTQLALAEWHSRMKH